MNAGSVGIVIGLVVAIILIIYAVISINRQI